MKAPSAPKFQQYAPYVAPNQSLMNSVENLPNPQSVVPQVDTPTQIMDQAAGVESQLPGWLQLTKYNGTQNPSAPGGQGGPFDQQLMNQMSNWYMQNQVAPGVAQAQSQMQSQGQNYGSYGGAMAGQMQAEGQQQAFQAALSANQQQYQDVLSGRQSYFGNDVALPQQQNAADVQRGLGVYGDMLGQAQVQEQAALGMSGQQNQYNLQTNPNQFNLQNYGNQYKQFQGNEQQLYGGIGSLIGLGGGILGLGTNTVGGKLMGF